MVERSVALSVVEVSKPYIPASTTLSLQLFTVVERSVALSVVEVSKPYIPASTTLSLQLFTVVERSRNPQPHPKPQPKVSHLSYNQNHPLHPHIPAMRHWPPGQQLHNNKYIIEAILGGDGFGVTYRAQNPKEDKETGKQP